MKKLFTFVIVLLLAAANMQAQKIDERMTMLLPSSNNTLRDKGSAERQRMVAATMKELINVSLNSDGKVESFSAFARLKEGAACPTAQLQKLGIEIRKGMGRMLILDIPAERLLELNDIDEIESVVADEKLETMNDKGREMSMVSLVATPEIATALSLPQAYTGKGVLVGVIDGGIDFNHAAFRNADGSTRVKLAIVSKSLKKSETYTDAKDIEGLLNDGTDDSHGTHVAGIAAGSVVEGLNLQGMAPEADLMLCGFGDFATQTNTVGALIQMFEFADEQLKPCVINMSLSEIANFHDGQVSPTLQFLREYYDTLDKKGRIVVISASNYAGQHAAISTALPVADSEGYNLKTVIGESKQEDYEGVKVNSYDLLTNFFYNLDGSEIDVDVFAVDVTTGDRYTLEQKPLYKSTGEAVTELLKAKATYPINNKNYVMYAQSGTIMFHEPNLKLAYYVKSAEGKTLKAFEKRKDDEAGFHSYGLEGFTEGQDNGAFTMDICGEEVISVGAYCSKETYTSIAGVGYGYTDGTQENAIVSYSAWGADDNGVNHPDVVAPGAIVCSTYNIYDKNFFDQEGQYKADQAMNITNVVKLFNRNHYYGTMEGTSMAAPNATGVIALWLQANPNLTYDDVRKLIIGATMTTSPPIRS